MPKLLGLVAVGVLTVFTAGSAQRGCRDLVNSATHLKYPPIRDMRYSVVVQPQKKLLLVPDSLSVPTVGRERDPGRDIMAATLKNPTPLEALEASVTRGEIKFQKNCIPCHGRSMMGDGPVAPLFMPPPDLLAEPTRQRTDGFIYSYVRHGGVVMPAYGAQVTPQEAWDLVNYVRHMQKVSPR